MDSSVSRASRWWSPCRAARGRARCRTRRSAGVPAQPGSPQARPEPRVAAPFIDTGYRTRARPVERCEEAGQIVRGHHHVAVAQHDHRMGDMRGHVHQVRDLAARAVPGQIDDEVDGGIRMAQAERLDGGNRRIVRPLHAAEQLDRPS